MKERKVSWKVIRKDWMSLQSTKSRRRSPMNSKEGGKIMINIWSTNDRWKACFEIKFTIFNIWFLRKFKFSTLILFINFQNLCSMIKMGQVARIYLEFDNPGYTLSQSPSISLDSQILLLWQTRLRIKVMDRDQIFQGLWSIGQKRLPI